MESKFRYRLKEAMDVRGLKQVDLSNRTGMGESNISQYCSGARKPRGDSLLDLAQALNVDAAWLLGYDVPMTAEKDHYSLTSDEKAVIDDYRALNNGGRAEFLKRMSELARLPEYTEKSALLASSA